MATRTAYPGTQAATDVLSSANVSKLPGGWIGYVEVTANQSTITAVVDLTSLTLTVTANTSRRLWWIGQIRAQANGATGYCQLTLTDATPTQKQQVLDDSLANANNDKTLPAINFIETPAAGSVTRKLRFGQAGADANTWQMSAAATTPAFLLCMDIGPSS